MQVDISAQKEFLQNVGDKLRILSKRVATTFSNLDKIAADAAARKVVSEELNAALSTERILNRRYGTTQACELAGISTTALYEAEEEGKLPAPDLKPDTMKRIRAGYTINQINEIRRVFDRVPTIPKECLGAIVGILNLKGGSQKTSTVHSFSHYLAIKGHRVLVVDVDPQGSLSFYYGKNPDVTVDYEHTIAPYMLEDDESLMEIGLPEGSSETLEYAVQETYWDNIDIIPACLQNLSIDLEIKDVITAAGLTPVEATMKLRNGLLGLADQYDFILIDGTPSLNVSTMNVLSACDMVFVPTPAAMLDVASSGKFISLMEETVDMYLESEIYPNLPDVRFFITKYSKSSYAEFMADLIRSIFNVEDGDVLLNICESSDEVGKAANKMRSIYEINPVDADNRKRLKTTLEMFDQLYDEMYECIFDQCFGLDNVHERISLLEKHRIWANRWDQILQKGVDGFELIPGSEQGNQLELAED